MPVTIVHKQFGKRTSDESKAAERLKGILGEVDADGSILIISNVSLPGGEPVKDVDIVVLGFLRDYTVRPYRHSSDMNVDTLVVRSFCITIELKRHGQDDVDFNQLGGVFVSYHRNQKHDVVDQSKNQRDALRNVLYRTIHVKPWVTNLIWLENVDENKVSYTKTGWNILFKDFKADQFFVTAANYNGVNPDRYDSRVNVLYSFKQELLKQELSKAFDLFLVSTTPKDRISREKFEFITNRSETVEVIKNGKLNVIKGRAGTGKTIQLIKFAYNEVVEGHKRCLLLTYNHALVSDIRRIAFFCDFPDGSEEAFSIRTIHSYFIELMGLNDIGTVFDDGDFESEYLAGLKALAALDSINLPCVWDYVLIDEAQDCKYEEIVLWGKLFSEGQIVIADGVDQFIRSSFSPSWSGVVSSDKISTFELSISKRQKNNIVSFVNAFAESAGISWHVEENRNLTGGKVIVTNKLDQGLFEDLKDKLLKAGNAMYDMLILVDSIMGSDQYMPATINGLRSKGIHVFNGAQYDNRTRYPLNPEECRLYNYNSCRGIEGWTVVCLNLDKLMEEKLRFAPPIPDNPFASKESLIARRERDVYKWMLMPLTRAIDTLVISLYDVNSPVGRLLYQLHLERSDYVIWRVE